MLKCVGTHFFLRSSPVPSKSRSVRQVFLGDVCPVQSRSIYTICVILSKAVLITVMLVAAFNLCFGGTLFEPRIGYWTSMWVLQSSSCFSRGYFD